jgi:hypothetical protein
MSEVGFLLSFAELWIWIEGMLTAATNWEIQIQGYAMLMTLWYRFLRGGKLETCAHANMSFEFHIPGWPELRRAKT